MLFLPKSARCICRQAAGKGCLNGAGILVCTCWMKSSDALSELELQLAAAAGAGARALFSAFADIIGAAAGDAIGDGAIASIKDPVASAGAAKVGTAFVYLLQMQQSSQNCLSNRSLPGSTFSKWG